MLPFFGQLLKKMQGRLSKNCPIWSPCLEYTLNIIAEIFAKKLANLYKPLSSQNHWLYFISGPNVIKLFTSAIHWCNKLEFFSGKHLLPHLFLQVRPEPTLEGKNAPLLGKLLSLPTYIKRGWRVLQGTNHSSILRTLLNS